MKNSINTTRRFSWSLGIVFLIFFSTANVCAAESGNEQPQQSSVRTFPFPKGPQRWTAKIRYFTPAPVMADGDFEKIEFGGIKLGLDFRNMLAFEIGGGIAYDLPFDSKGGFFHVLAGVSPTLVDGRTPDQWRGWQLQLPLLIGMNVLTEYVSHDGDGPGQRTAGYVKLMTGAELTRWFNRRIGLVLGFQIAFNFMVSQSLSDQLEYSYLSDFNLEPQLSIGLAF